MEQPLQNPENAENIQDENNATIEVTNESTSSTENLPETSEVTETEINAAPEAIVEQPVVEAAIAEVEIAAENHSDANPLTDEPLEEAVAPAALTEEAVTEVAEDAVTNEAALDESADEKPKAKKSSTKKSAKEIAAEEAAVLAAEAEKEAEPEPDYSTFSKEQLVTVLEETVATADVAKLKNRVSLVKVAFLNIVKEEKKKHFDDFTAEGGVKEEYVPYVEPLEEKFKAAFDIYKEKKGKADREQEKVKQDNLKDKIQILAELKVLVTSEESLKKTYDEFKLLQDRWKNSGPVPREEINNLWQNYHFLTEKFFDKVKINKELKDLDLRKNLELKMQICEKAEELLLDKSITRSFKQLQRYHEEWKEIGPVPQDKKDEIWERFKTVSDKINEQRKEYYEKVSSEQEDNLMAKTALCEKLEAITTSDIMTVNEWKEKTDAVSEIQQLWESLGRAPANSNDHVWTRFRAGMNAFYDHKKEFFSELKDGQTNNYNLKVDLCVQAEALKDNDNWKQTTMALLKLQDEWKKIGPVPRKFSDKIWKRFRGACDEFFKRKAEYFSNVQGMEQENLTKKEDLIKQVIDFEILDDKTENLNALKNFQRAFMEVGHVPMDHKDRLHTEFRTAINNLMDKLKISQVEMNTLNFKSRIENIKGSPDSGKMLSKERSSIEVQASRLKSDILLWENNLGFFANSKNASILKEEFEKKIHNAKQELLLLEAKVKMLAKQDNEDRKK
jgi:hypothetical protein